jgi:NAD(P)-dependent dehydrogenase (short-subunit alcohol dehydrogenase family)
MIEPRQQEFNLVGKVAIVTGAARHDGIGAACARAIANAGAKVVITDIMDDQGRQVADSMNAAGGSAVYKHLDVRSESAWTKIIAEIVREHGGFDILVNNAGTTGNGAIEDLPLSEWKRTRSINLDSVFLGTKQAIIAMKPGGVAGKGGSIINMGSVTSFVGVANASAYVGTKGGVRLLSKCAAIECGKLGYNIRVNTLVPGFIETGLLKDGCQNMVDQGLVGSVEEIKEAFRSGHPIGRIGQPMEVGLAACFLASDASAFITGADLVVDGGYTAQ